MVHAQPIKNAIAAVARPLPLSSVRVTGGPLKRAQDLNADYLLKLEPDRMMAYYRKRADLRDRSPGVWLAIVWWKRQRKRQLGERAPARFVSQAYLHRAGWFVADA